MNLMHKILFYNNFSKCLYMFRALCADHQEVKIVLYSIWYQTVGGRLVHRLKTSSLNLCNGRPPTGVIQFWPPDDEHIVLETCRGI